MLARSKALALLRTMAFVRMSHAFAQGFVPGAQAFRSVLITSGVSSTNKRANAVFSRAFQSSGLQSVAARDSLAETSKGGEFQRRDSAWRNFVEKDGEFPPESGRYHLYVAYACPWAHRTLMTRNLKGLQNTISCTLVHPIWQKTRPGDDEHRGWVFSDPKSKEPLTNSEGRGGPFLAAYPDNEAEPQFGSKSVRDLYDHAGDTEGKYTVPILWDKKKGTIVSNESAEIIRMLNAEFNEFAEKPDLDLCPQSLLDSIDEVNEWVYDNLNNGVYRCGFAKTQEAYDKAIADLTEAFDKVDRILQKQRYVAGDTFTEADVRLFVTLVRFDEVYTVYFKCNTRSVTASSAILNYCREIYQMPGVKETVDMEQIKMHYYASHPELNYYSIVPKGNDFLKLLEESHNRHEL